LNNLGRAQYDGSTWAWVSPEASIRDASPVYNLDMVIALVPRTEQRLAIAVMAVACTPGAAVRRLAVLRVHIDMVWVLVQGAGNHDSVQRAPKVLPADTRKPSETAIFPGCGIVDKMIQEEYEPFLRAG
jgi:hypothetical protein